MAAVDQVAGLAARGVPLPPAPVVLHVAELGRRTIAEAELAESAAALPDLAYHRGGNAALGWLRRSWAPSDACPLASPGGPWRRGRSGQGPTPSGMWRAAAWPFAPRPGAAGVEVLLGRRPELEHHRGGAFTSWRVASRRFRTWRAERPVRVLSTRGLVQPIVGRRGRARETRRPSRLVGLREHQALVANGLFEPRATLQGVAEPRHVLGLQAVVAEPGGEVRERAVALPGVRMVDSHPPERAGRARTCPRATYPAGRRAVRPPRDRARSGLRGGRGDAS